MFNKSIRPKILFGTTFTHKVVGIYKITSPTGRIYIGESGNISERWSKYRRYNCKPQPHLCRSLKKYGVDNHIFEIEHEYILNEIYSKKIHKPILKKLEDNYIHFYKNFLENDMLNVAPREDLRDLIASNGEYNESLISIYKYVILSEKTGELIPSISIRHFCDKYEVKSVCRFTDTIYKYTLSGQPTKFIDGYKIVSKLYFDENRDNTELLKHINNINEYRYSNRTFDPNYIEYVYEIYNKNTNITEYITDIDEFSINYLNNTLYVLLDTLYGYTKNGKKVYHTNGYTLKSKHFLDKNLDDTILQKEIADEIYQRSLILKDISYKPVIHNEFSKLTRKKLTIFTVENINTGEHITKPSLKDIFPSKSTLWCSKLCDTLYGYDIQGTKQYHRAGYRIISKKCIDKNIDIDLQKHILKIKEERYKLWEELHNKINYSYKILDTNTNIITEENNLADFCKRIFGEHDWKTNHGGMSQTHKIKKYVYKGYKVLEKIVTKKFAS
jgi:hypothetical protein